MPADIGLDWIVSIEYGHLESMFHCRL